MPDVPISVRLTDEDREQIAVCQRYHNLKSTAAVLRFGLTALYREIPEKKREKIRKEGLISSTNGV